MSWQLTSVKNKKSYQPTGYLGGAGSYITWTGTVTESIGNVANIPYTGNYSAYYGTLGGLTSYIGSTNWSNAALRALGGANLITGLGVWGGQLNTTTVATIGYTFSSPVPAGASFLLVDPGASYPEYSGSETFKVSATYNGSAVSTSGWTFSVQSPTGGATPATGLTIDAAAGTITISSYAASTWPDLVIVITPDAPVSSISVTANTIPYDSWALTLPHIPSALLFQFGNTGSASAGGLACWQLNGSVIMGGGSINNPGPAWSYVGTGDFQGFGGTGILFRNVSGTLAFWTVSGVSVVNIVTLGSPGGTWSVIGVGDYNGDGRSDILFEDASHNYGMWMLNGAAIIGGGQLWSPGPGWRFLATADLNGGGYSDILFQNVTTGVLAEWLMNGMTVSKVVTLAAPPAGTSFAGVGDFNGDSVSDILFKNPTLGQYSAWLMNSSGAAAVTATLCTPGVGETLVSIGAYTVASASDLIFENTATGILTAYDFSNAKLTYTGDIGTPGAFFFPVRAPYAAPPPIPTVYFGNGGGVFAFWNVAFGGIQNVATFGGALSGSTFLAGGDFNGDAQPDFLMQTPGGGLSVYMTNGSQITGGGAIGSPGGTWSYQGIGDFNGDGAQDVLFADASGNYAAWLLNGANVIGGGTYLGNPGAGSTLAAIADVSCKGTSDLIFRDPSGNYAVWFYANGAFVNSAPLGNPVPGATLIGTGDYNGDGRADLLFQTDANAYRTVDLNAASVVGGGSFNGPGADWTYLGSAELYGDGCASILFRNPSTGAVAADNMFDATILSTQYFASPGGGFTALTVI